MASILGNIFASVILIVVGMVFLAIIIASATGTLEAIMTDEFNDTEDK